MGWTGKPSRDLSVPVDDHAAEQVAHGGEARAVDAHGGFAAPAVMDTQIGAGGGGDRSPKGVLLGRKGFFVIFTEKTTFCIPLPAVGEDHPLPALFVGRSYGGDQRPPGQGDQGPELHGGAGEHVGDGLATTCLGRVGPAADAAVPEEKALPPGHSPRSGRGPPPDTSRCGCPPAPPGSCRRGPHPRAGTGGRARVIRGQIGEVTMAFITAPHR